MLVFIFVYLPAAEDLYFIAFRFLRSTKSPLTMRQCESTAIVCTRNVVESATITAAKKRWLNFIVAIFEIEHFHAAFAVFRRRIPSHIVFSLEIYFKPSSEWKRNSSSRIQHIDFICGNTMREHLRWVRLSTLPIAHRLNCGWGWLCCHWRST